MDEQMTKKDYEDASNIPTLFISEDIDNAPEGAQDDETFEELSEPVEGPEVPQEEDTGLQEGFDEEFGEDDTSEDDEEPESRPVEDSQREQTDVEVSEPVQTSEGPQNPVSEPIEETVPETQVGTIESGDKEDSRMSITAEGIKVPRRKKGRDDDVDPDSLGERFRRWKLCTFHGYVKLRTLSRASNGEYKMETTLVKFKDLPRDAVACTREKGFYCLDKIGNSDWYYRTHYKNLGLRESQFTASDACLYMQSNKMDNALTVNWTESAHRDFTKFVIYGGIALAVILVILLTR